MININIFNIFWFSTFSLEYFTNPAICLILKKISLKTGSRKYPREKVQKQIMLKKCLYLLCVRPPKKFHPFFGHFYPISLNKFALTPKTRPQQFTRNQTLSPAGK